jgi:pilus assembly protein Flp/PilA
MMHQTQQVGVLLRRFASDESGVTAIEYGLLVSGIAVVLIATLNSTGEKLFGLFSYIADSLSAQN